MCKGKKPDSSSERRNGGNVFNVLVQMVRNQQNQLQSFANQQKFLEDRLRMQHERLASDVGLYKNQISQVKGFLMFEEKKRLLQAAKADLMVGSKHREASILKWILDSTKDELEDLKSWFEYLSHKSSNEDQEKVFKDTGKRKKGTTNSGNKFTCNSAEKEKCSDKIRDELRRLKDECEKLALEKDSEVLALLQEKKFVWNQYNTMENDYTNKLRTKQDEVEKANEKIKVLISSMEQMQSENSQKDSRKSELESKVADMEAETKRLNKEISGLSVQLESLRKFRNNQVTPVLNPCTAGASTSGNIKSNRSRRNDTLNKEKETCAPHAHSPSKSSEKSSRFKEKEICTPDAHSPSKSSEKSSRFKEKEICTPDAHSPSKSSEKGKKSLKRKEGPVVPTSETPKLFSSSFKVPKLKPSIFSHQRQSFSRGRQALDVAVFSSKD